MRRLLDPSDVDALTDLLQRAALFEPNAITPVCRDPSDDYLLALADAADADVLVTRDEDLLALKRHGRTEIIHVAEFLTRTSEP